MSRFLPGGLWAEALLGILSLLALARGTPVVKCEEPTVENGIKLSGFQDSYTSGDHMTFECKIGYFLIGSYFIQCENNTWHPKIPRCEKITSHLCGAPVIPKGRVEPELPQYDFGRAISLQCNSNHYFIDETIEMIITCKGYNVWEPPPQPCILRTSNDTYFLIITNGQVIYGKKKLYEPGDEVAIRCEPGYAINGPAHIRYIGNGRWLPELPSCSLSAFYKLLITAFVLILLLLVVKQIYQKCRTL